MAGELDEAARAAGAAPAPAAPPDLDALVAAWQARAADALGAVRAVLRATLSDADIDELAGQFGRRLRAALAAALARSEGDDRDTDGGVAAFVAAALPPDTATWGALLGWLAAEAVGGVIEPDRTARQARGWFDRTRLGRVFADAYRWRGLDEGAAWWTVETVRHLIARPGRAALGAPAAERPGRLVRAWFADDELARWLGVNRHHGIAYVNRESFEAALRWLVVVVAVTTTADARTAGATGATGGAPGPTPADAHALAVRLADDAAAAGYEVGAIIERATT